MSETIDNSSTQTGFFNRQRFAPINPQGKAPNPSGSNIGQRIMAGNMFATPQADINQSGGFPNRNLLQLDPKSGNASRYRLTDPRSNMPAISKPPSPLAQQLAALGSPVEDAKQKVQQYSTPTPSRDAQGKTLRQYRMGIGHRILGTLANFANGFAGNRVAPIYVGPGALNRRYYQDEETRQQNLEGAQRNLATLQGRIPTSLHDVIDYKTVYRDGKGTWKGRTYGGQVREGIEAPAYEASPDEDDDTPQNQDSPVQLPQPHDQPA